MALRDQPYIPLYVQDYLTDEKLSNCSTSTQGVYIKIMCLFHKCDPYGGILLQQKDQQNENICYNFAAKLSRLLPFTFEEINNSIEELVDGKVLHINDNFLYQKRMVHDNTVSESRSLTGSKGGKKTALKNKYFATAKIKQNHEYENENENENINDNNKELKGINSKRENSYNKNLIRDIFFKIEPEYWNEFSDVEKSLRKSIIVSELTNSDTWISNTAMSLNLNADKVQSKLNEFISDLDGRDEFYKDFQDLKSYFFNYCKNSLKTNTEQKKQSTYISPEQTEKIAGEVLELMEGGKK